MTVHTRWNVSGCWNEPVKMVISAMKPLSPGNPKIGKTGDYIADSQKRHNLHQTGEFADVTRMGTSVYHTDKGEEQGCHQSVREHLQNSTRASCLVHHQDGEQHQPQWLTEE